MKPNSLPLLVLALLAFSFPARAELKPAQIAILVKQGSAESKKIGDYYASKRGIPAKQILSLDMPSGEVLTRADWDTKVRPQIRNWVAKNRLQNQLKCFVTTYDVPLKIGPTTKVSVATRRRKSLLQLERKRRVEQLLKIATDFDGIQPDGTAQQLNLDGASELKAVSEALSKKLKAAEARINPMAAGDEKQAAIRKLTQLSIATAGLQVIVQNMQRSLNANTVPENSKARVGAEFQFGRGRLAGLNEGQQLLDGLPSTIERDTNLIALIERAGGIAATVNWIDQQMDLITKNETHSSFDSELSLVLEGNYPLLRWLPNYLHYNYDGSPLREITRTLMVSRLEAPTPALTQGLIDKAIQVEASGLKGKVYLDARGQLDSIEDPVQQGTIKDYDKSLLLAEKMFRDNTNLEVVLDNNIALFAAGKCPDTALYCGWYQLSKYVPAFTWNPGSIGYHMASAEAATLRNPESQVWCKKMLDNGVAGTYGPVYEPYLLAFPRPNEFFALLCSGKYTYAECMYRTKTTNSWTMTTVGDPLYNPFRNAPALKSVPKGYEKVFGVGN